MGAAATSAFRDGGTRRRWATPLAYGLATGLGLVCLYVNALRATRLAGQHLLGADYDIYVVFARRYVETGSMYLPFQLTGPYDGHLPGPHDGLASLYPPVALLLFLPFLVLPAVLWWAIPLAGTGWAIARLRPSIWVWPAVFAILLLQQAAVPILVGNTVMWLMAGVALGFTVGWPALIVVIKPTFLPFVLAGVRYRSWWIGGAVLGVLCLVFGGLWFDYLAAVRNSVTTDLTYSLDTTWLLVIPILAWLGRERGSSRSPT